MLQKKERLEFSNIPLELKQRNNWVLWKLEKRKGKYTKVPYQSNSKLASSTDPNTWTNFEKAIEIFNTRNIYSGIGFMLSNSGITGIDIDHCINENGVISDFAQYYINSFGSYVEKSQSGNGIHILVKGHIFKAIKKDIEVYSEGRYFAITGNKLQGDTLEERQDLLDKLYEKYHSDSLKTNISYESRPDINLEEQLNKAFNSKNGNKIKTLFDGNWESLGYRSQSEADQSLCNYLGFWLNKDFDCIDEAFKKSGLYRDKWDRPDYKATTIYKAINNCTKSYQEYIVEKRKEEDNAGIDFPYKNKKGVPLRIWENLDYLFRLNNIELKYNLLSREIEVPRCKRSLDELLVEFNTLALTNGFDLNINEMARFVTKIAYENSYNPVIDYLKKCKNKWDGISRIKDLCDTIETNADNEFKELLITKWLINAVHIICNKGESNCEGILVIQGKQGIGKTRWIRSIIPNQDWLKTGVSLDPVDKDSVLRTTKYWIVELGELDATFKRDQAALKQFFTEETDEHRVPYGRFPTKFPRLTCFYATVNDLEFLKDLTGNRRYWAIEATSINVNHNIDIDQLWGEIATLYSTGKITNWLTEEETEKLQKNNRKFEVKSSSEIKLLDMFDWSNADTSKWKYLTATQICQFIEEKNPVLIGKAIKKMMLHNKLIKFNTNGRKYLLPPRKDMEDI